MRSNAIRELDSPPATFHMVNGNFRHPDWQYDEASQSVSDWRLDDVFVEAYELTEQAGKKNWDGYNAEPVNASHLTHVFSLLSRLPSKYEMPKLIPEPEGAIGMEWSRGNASIIMSYIGNEVVTYSLIKNDFSSYGSFKEDAFGDFIKQLDLIYEI